MRAVRFAAVVFAGLGVACSTAVHVDFDEREDFSRYRTWSWRPSGAQTVEAPLSNAPALDAVLARLVEGALHARGFQHSRDTGDFFVAYHLTVERDLVTVNETGAMQHLSSLHDSPSYSVQVTKSELRNYESARLVIIVTQRDRQRPIWRGAFWGRFRDEFAPHLSRAVSRLLEHFPRATKPAAPAPSSPPEEPRKHAHRQTFSFGLSRVMIGVV